MSQPHPWTQQTTDFVILSPKARAARAAYLRRWNDRLRSHRMAGVTDPQALPAAFAALAKDRQDDLQ